jgi:hypothetical protein
VGATVVECVYVAGALLEVAGVGCVIWGLSTGRRRARAFKRERPHFGRDFRFSRGLRAPALETAQVTRQQRKLENEQEHQKEEILGLLAGRRSEWIGAILLILGIVAGTVANIANTR